MSDNPHALNRSDDAVCCSGKRDCLPRANGTTGAQCLRSVSLGGAFIERRRRTMTNEAKTVNKMTVEEWLAIRREAALQIDSETAEVTCKHANIVDPYGMYPNSEECIGRVCFARASGSDVWVCFDDLPDATVKALREKQELRRAFPEPTVYRRPKELFIVGDDQEQFVRVRIEQASKLIEKMRAALKEHEANSS
jgi:hypothetical protein